MITIGENRIYLAIIHNGHMPGRTGDVALRSMADLNNVAPVWGGAERPCAALNAAWCAALNSRRQFEWSHFCAVRANVRPWGDDWAGMMLDEMRRVSVDWLSVVLPVAGNEGHTDTAIDKIGPSETMTRRLTMKEVHPLPHVTFSGPELRETMEVPDNEVIRLLTSTRMFVCSFRQPWVEDVVFKATDAIVRRKGKNDKPGAGVSKLLKGEEWAADLFEPIAEPDGWVLSRWMADKNIPYAATKRIPCGVLDVQEWGNMVGWGTLEHADWVGF